MGIVDRKRGELMYRIGQSSDIHRLSEGRKLILGGVHIPFEKGLLGHSDADVLLHSIGASIFPILMKRTRMQILLYC